MSEGQKDENKKGEIEELDRAKMPAYARLILDRIDEFENETVKKFEEGLKKMKEWEHDFFDPKNEDSLVYQFNKTVKEVNDHGKMLERIVTRQPAKPGSPASSDSSDSTITLPNGMKVPAQYLNNPDMQNLMTKGTTGNFLLDYLASEMFGGMKRVGGGGGFGLFGGKKEGTVIDWENARFTMKDMEKMYEYVTKLMPASPIEGVAIKSFIRKAWFTRDRTGLSKKQIKDLYQQYFPDEPNTVDDWEREEQSSPGLPRQSPGVHFR